MCVSTCISVFVFMYVPEYVSASVCLSCVFVVCACVCACMYVCVSVSVCFLSYLISCLGYTRLLKENCVITIHAATMSSSDLPHKHTRMYTDV